MTAVLIIVPTICYASAAVMYAIKDNWPLAATYAGYAFANCGLLALDLQAR